MFFRGTFLSCVRLAAAKPHEAFRSLPKLDHVQHELGQYGDLIKKPLVMNGLFKRDRESASRTKSYLNQVQTFCHVFGVGSKGGGYWGFAGKNCLPSGHFK